MVFYAGPVNSSDQIGSGTLSAANGKYQATFSTHGLTVNGSPYAITAVYGGDTNDQGSTSSALAQTITPAPLVITANNQSKVYGAALPTLDGELLGLRQRRQLVEPDDAADGLDDRDVQERGRQLHDHG